MVKNTNILTDISKYDIREHKPIPFVSFIKEQTSMDLVLINGNDSKKAEQQALLFTTMSWQIMMEDKLNDTQKRLEYLIATNEEYRFQFLKYVCSVISSFYMGNSGIVENTQADKLRDTLSPFAKSYLTNGILSTQRFRHFNYEYRKGY